MFAFLKSLFAPKKNPGARSHILVRGDRLLKGGYSSDLEKYIYRLRLNGWMRPSESFVEFDLEGTRANLELFLKELQKVPTWSRVDKLEVAWVEEYKGFTNYRKRS
jgi:acylphosphatase